MATIISLNQKTTTNENLYMKTIPASQSFSGEDENFVLTLEQLEKRKANLEAQIAEINSDILEIQGIIVPSPK